MVQYNHFEKYLYVIWRNEEGGKANNDKKPAWQIVSDDIVSHFPLHVKFKACHWIVASFLGQIVPFIPI